jgi:hypothetical protein
VSQSVSQRTAAVQPLWLLLLEAVAEARGQFGNPEEGERPSLEAVTRARLMNTQQTEKT